MRVPSSERSGPEARRKTPWESGDYACIDPIVKERRFHRVLVKNGNLVQIVDPRGRVQQVAGTREFGYLDARAWTR